MERAEILTRLRGDHVSNATRSDMKDRFLTIFGEKTPENARKVVSKCLERDPNKRPSAEELLAVRVSNNKYIMDVYSTFRISPQVPE